MKLVCGRKEGRKVVCGTRKEVDLWHEEGSWFVARGRKLVCGRKEGSWFVVGRKEGRWFVARGRKLICGTRKEVGLW